MALGTVERRPLSRRRYSYRSASIADRHSSSAGVFHGLTGQQHLPGQRRPVEGAACQDAIGHHGSRVRLITYAMYPVKSTARLRGANTAVSDVRHQAVTSASGTPDAIARATFASVST